ncbi:glycosyltransferase family 2 protein [Novosphingobium bradum]|uniref:Glycosyltransferase family 2 protein n=1 Tax=Novosphingobium bradum TaxID=1737444 RepID=A0ABV7IKZ4_9SPHN
MSPFYREFMETLRWRPLQALTGLYWHLTRRRLRAIHCLRRDWHTASDAYMRWTRLVERNGAEVERLAAESAGWPDRPTLSLFVETGAEPPAALAAQIASILGQPWAEWELLVCGDGSTAGLPDDPRIRPIAVARGATALEAALAAARGSHLLPLAPGAILPGPALLRWAEAVRATPPATLAYADEDLIAPDGERSAPWFKPAWQRELLLSQDYLSSCCLVPVEAGRALLPLDPAQRRAPLYALLLELTHDPAPPVIHLPHVQVHLGQREAEPGQANRVAVLRRHLAPLCADAEAGPFGTHRAIWPLPAQPPLVSIVIPTRDKAHLLRACLDSVLGKTTWPAFEILVVDNNSEEAATFACFADYAAHPAVKVLADPRPYNFSAINNRAIEAARGDYVCLLNNDTEVIAPQWLDELMRQAVRPEAGAVGAKLLYPDGSIQHAGVVIGMGNAAGHAHRLLPEGEAGYFAQAHVAREATAVTAACLVVGKRKLETIGGLDEDHLAIAYNDVDLCLKLRAAGWTNFYVPTARLFHHESVSRGDDFSPEHNQRYLAELKVLQERWGTATFIDPLHHPRLDRASDQYAMAFRMDDPR